MKELISESKAWTGCMGLVLLGALLLVPACLITDGTGASGGECETHCYEYWSCERYCDPGGCYEAQCHYEESCEAVCDDNAGLPDESEIFDEPPVCYSGIECQQGRVCVDGKCTGADRDESGRAGLCQTCESSSDCTESGALCLGLNTDGETAPTETICGRFCESDGQCPTGFECLAIANSDDAAAQCVPEVVSGQRSCSGAGELECVTASDCAVGESCVNNTCQPPADAECTDDSGCPAGERCHVFECVDDPEGAECIGAPDCAGDQICADGQCVDQTQGCVFNTDCSDDQRCVNGQCINTCDGDSDCGSSQRCRQGICEYIECSQSADCAGGHICVEASCQKSCGTDGDCAAGFMCAALGYCTPDPDVECRSSAECDSHEICSEELACVTPCDCNQQCVEGQVCDESSGLCEEAGEGAEEIECEDDCECPSGMSCDAGQCQ